MSNKRVWFITGAGRGMGADFAKAALASGHAVVATGRNTDAVSKALGTSNDLLPVKLDVTNRTDAAAAVRKGVPLERFGNAEDMGGLVLCLCGAGGAYISGAIIPLDGGMTAFRTPGIEQGV